jgi:hypothetical protein
MTGSANFGGDWRDLVQKVLKVYNDTKSSSTGFAPDDVTDPEHFSFIHAVEMEDMPAPHAKLRGIGVGDRVRILIDTDVFKKGSRPKFSKEIYAISGREGYSFTLEDTAGNPVMATNVEGGKLNDVRPFRAWELLPVQSDRVQAPPRRRATQRLADKDKHVARVVNRDRKRVGAPPIVQDTPDPNVYAQTLEREAVPRDNRSRTKVAKVQAADAPKLRAARVLRPKEWYVNRVLDHRERKGKLEFKVQWVGLPEGHALSKKWYPLEPTFQTGATRDAKVGAYMEEHGLT